MTIDHKEELASAVEDMELARSHLSSAWKKACGSGKYAVAESLARTMKAIQSDIDRLGNVQPSKIKTGRLPSDWFLLN